MRTDSLIFRKLTSTEFKAITNTINSAGGGSQTYIDFPKGKISDVDFQEFFNNSGREVDNGFEWSFKVSCVDLGEPQEALISARRAATNSLREQNNNNRLQAWKPEISGFPTEGYDETISPIILYILHSTDNSYWAGWFYRNECADSWFMSKGLSRMIWEDCGYIKLDTPIEFDNTEFHWPFGKEKTTTSGIQQKLPTSYNKFTTALRTKPFLLLAGISGTGKSQKVQELAFMTCPEGKLREEGGTTPGNYCLIEVKPNWHDSTELLGYYSALTGRYELTDFIRFVYKAIQNENVPFFLCLDEMNLAPVEQYFAEFLSVLETRKRVGEHIVSEPLLPKMRFNNCKLQEYIHTEGEGVVVIDGENYNMKDLYQKEDREVMEYLMKNGLGLPDNLFVIGTVNMDDTTHQFSRKVIDRAFTIEMNGGKLSDMFTPESKMLLEYREEPLPLDAFKSVFVRAHEVLDHEKYAKYKEVISKQIPLLLGDSDGSANPDSVNGVLNNTPFRVSYRVQNELVLYLSVLIERAGFPEPDNISGLIAEATLAILLEKVLPRIQGEQKQLETKKGASNVLKDLKTFVEDHLKPAADSENDSVYNEVIRKLTEMNDKLTNYYTNFF